MQSAQIVIPNKLVGDEVTCDLDALTQAVRTCGNGDGTRVHHIGMAPRSCVVYARVTAAIYSYLRLQIWSSRADGCVLESFFGTWILYVHRPCVCFTACTTCRLLAHFPFADIDVCIVAAHVHFTRIALLLIVQ